MNALFKFLFALGMLVGLVLAIGFHFMSEPGSGTLGVVLSLIGAAGCFAGLVWTFYRRGELPDVLREAGLPCFERQGLGFAVAAGVEGGRTILRVICQNRFSGRCQVEILVRPDHKAAEAGLRRIRVRLECGGGEVTLSSHPWAIPPSLGGQKVRLAVGADVVYREDRGRILRYREGIPADPVANAEMHEAWELLRSPSSVEFKLPEDLPEPTAPTAADRVTPNPVAAVASPAPAAAESPVVPQPSTSSEDPRPAPDTARGVGVAESGVSEERLRELLAELDADPGLTAHAGEVVRMKRIQNGEEAVMAFGALLLFGAMLGYGVLAWRNEWQAPFRLIAVILGGIGTPLAALATGGMVMGTLSRPKSAPATSVVAVCELFYRAAFTAMRQGKAHLIHHSECFPVSVTAPVAGSDETAAALTRTWKDVLERHATVDLKVAVEEVRVREGTPESGGRVVPVQVILSGTGFPPIAFANLAIRAGTGWFLATAEPRVVPSPASP